MFPFFFLSSGAAPGWAGRLPGMGDFSHRRLPQSFREPWMRWLRAGMARMQERHLRWAEHYLEAPRWCFVLGNDVVDAQGWIGMLVPSVDEMGRLFPFTMATELASADSEIRGAELARVRDWWLLAGRAALDGAREHVDAPRFEALLQRHFAADAAMARDAGGVLALPVVGQSLWLIDPTAEDGPGIASHGLPQDDQFDALFGCTAGVEPGDPGAR